MSAMTRWGPALLFPIHLFHGRLPGLDEMPTVSNDHALADKMRGAASALARHIPLHHQDFLFFCLEASLRAALGRHPSMPMPESCHFFPPALQKKP